MAISSNYWFDYEAILAPDAAGSYSGVARSLQAEAGALPGLAGCHPRLSAIQDALLVESDPSEAPPGGLWSLMQFVPILAGVHLDRRLRSASVQSIGMTLPGLTGGLKPGVLVRVSRALLAAPGMDTVTKIRALIVTPDGERMEWNPSRLTTTPWGS